MKILLAPFAKKLREKDASNPKDFPFGKKLVELLKENGHEIIQVGIEGEPQLVEDFRKNLSFKEFKELVNSADTFIAVDSFLQHLAWFLNKKGIVLWSQSNPKIFGHDLHINLLKSTEFLRKEPFNVWEAVDCNDDAFVSPEIIVQTLKDNFEM